MSVFSVTILVMSCNNNNDVDLQGKVSTSSPPQRDVMLHCGLEGYVDTIVVEIIWGVYTCVSL